MEKEKISKFKPILPARYNTAAYMEWRNYFSNLGTAFPITYFERLDLPIRNFLILSSLESTEVNKIPLVILSKEITPNLSMNFSPVWFKDFFGTLKQLRVEGVIVTDRSDEGKEINRGIKSILENENNHGWMVDSVESFNGIEKVCEKYIEKIEERGRFNIEYRENK